MHYLGQDKIPDWQKSLVEDIGLQENLRTVATPKQLVTDSFWREVV